MAELPDDVRRLFEGPNFGHLATLGPDGSPFSVAVWVGLEGEHVVFFTQPGTQKARNIERDPRVAISLVDFEHPYRTGRIRGVVEKTVEGEEALPIIDRLSERYTGQPFPLRSGRVHFIRPDRAGSMELPFEHRPA